MRESHDTNNVTLVMTVTTPRVISLFKIYDRTVTLETVLTRQTSSVLLDSSAPLVQRAGKCRDYI